VSAGRVLVYGFHDRTWHWIQAGALLGLLASGFQLRFPGLLPGVGFQAALSVHVGLGAFLLVNAGLGLFYFVTSGAISHYLPRPRDPFSLALEQARYYLGGIFRGAPHPFEKTARARLNPLQQLTYLAILNLLLPWQLVSGVLLWLRGGELGLAPGALDRLGPLHALGAWAFAAFLIVHLYLTTTGPTPLAHLRAMVTGWEDAPAPEPLAAARAAPDPAADAVGARPEGASAEGGSP
jgi:thiosulfate reductase cytochrome b subunit